MRKRLITEEQRERHRAASLAWYYRNKESVSQRMKEKREAQRPEVLRHRIRELREELKRYEAQT